MAIAVHELAKSKGWHDENETEDHFIERMCNNAHGEVCELYEAWRNNKLHSPCDKAEGMIAPLTCLEEEMADIIIRALDASVKLGIDIRYALEVKHEFNKTRPIRHGGKRS